MSSLGRLRGDDAGLVALDLSGSPPEDGDGLALALAAALVGNNKLVSLQLRTCGIGAFGATGLGRVLATNTVLRSIEYVS